MWHLGSLGQADPCADLLRKAKLSTSRAASRKGKSSAQKYLDAAKIWQSRFEDCKAGTLIAVPGQDVAEAYAGTGPDGIVTAGDVETGVAVDGYQGTATQLPGASGPVYATSGGKVTKPGARPTMSMTTQGGDMSDTIDWKIVAGIGAVALLGVFLLTRKGGKK